MLGFVAVRYRANKKRIWLLALVFITAFGFYFFHEKSGMEPKPLYWVAPMDPNYRRDGPGLSPMGMDLIPVYAEASAGTEHSPGVVNISPEIQNQLGVRTEFVQRARLKQQIRSQGRVVFDQALLSKLSPRVTGWVDMLFVAAEGEPVKRGQPLYSLFSPELVKAQEVFLRALNAKNKRQTLEAETQLRALRMDEVAISKLRDEGAAQNSVVFRSPKDGMVGMLKIAEDTYVEPGNIVMVIGSLESVWIELNVFESLAGLISPGQYITFSTPAYPGRIWEAEVDYIFHAINSSSKNLLFRAKIENPKMLLKPNMQIHAYVSLPDREPQNLVSRQSIIDLGESQYVVLALGDGKFKSVRVVTGESNSELIEVLSGLEEGDKVVASAQFLIDSESSKTSDFQRMSVVEPEQKPVENTHPVAWVVANVEEVNLEAKTLRLHHEPIVAWGMPSMTMNFKVADGVAIEKSLLGKRIEVQLADGDPLFQVLNIKTIDAGSSE